MAQRSPGMVIFLSIITCGIYGLYWMCVTNDDVNNAVVRKEDGGVVSGGMLILLGIVTCGIYTIYWWYKIGQRAAQLMFETNLPVTDNATVYLLLSIFGLSIVNMALLQSSLNRVWVARQNGGGGGNGGGYNNGGGYPNNGQYPPQNNGQYPPQNNGQYPPQNNGQYPPQNNGGYQGDPYNGQQNNGGNNNNNNGNNDNGQWL